MSVIPLRVAVRARPLIQKEIDEGCQKCLTFVSGEPQLILGKDKTFTYDYVFSPDTGQVTVYTKAVEPLIEHIFKGYNATVLAYGQTGSGKTFSMGGGYEASLKMDPEGMGIIPRLILDLFNISADKAEYDYCFKVSYLEIINEELQDLLCSNKSREQLSVREENGEIKIQGLKEVETKSAADTMRLLEQGGVNRTTAATAMNSSSSRSHAVFTVYMEQKHKEDLDNFWRAKLQLVDLAGSERIKKTHAEGERLKEGININKGLLSLGNVISALGDESQKKMHVPYRDSKLTRILSDSLGGNSHTLMIACVSPADSNMEETLNTLRYADRARKIKNKPVINWDPQTAKIMQLQEHVQQLKMKLIHAGITDFTSSTVNSSSENTPTKQNLREKLREMTESCERLKEENAGLAKDLQHSVDQAATMFEKAIKQEMKCEKLEACIKEYEDRIESGLSKVDFDLLSSSMADGPPEVTEQIEYLKTLAEQVEEKSVLNAVTEDSMDGEEENAEGDDSLGEMPFTPESREMAKQHTLRRAKMNSDLEQLNKMLEMKEKIANQMAQDNNLQALKEQYEDTMKQYEGEITGLQKEKENLLTALEDAKTNSAANKISEQRRKRLNELESQLSDLKKKLVEQKKLLKNKEQADKEVSKLNAEIQSMKQQRVKLMKQMKEDGDQWRKWRQQKDKEVIQLQQKDRKRQFEMQKLQREHQRTQSVLQRKSEEAAAANRRLKEALSKQKKVLDERTQKFEKMDNASTGDRIRKLLSHELDVKVGVAEAKYHREVLLQDRKTLAEELKNLKECLDDNGPPAKKMAWMDDSGQKCETSFQEEKKKKRIEILQQQIELLNVQIADLQQKVFDAEQESKGKSAKENLHTMMEAKIAIKWLMEQCVNGKVENGRLTVEMKDVKDNMQENRTDHDKYISELEEEIDELKRTQQSAELNLMKEHKKQIDIFKSMVDEEYSNTIRLKEIEIEKQKAKVTNLQAKLVEKDRMTEEMEKHIKICMYKEKNLALMPDLTDDEDHPPVPKSPFLSPRPKVMLEYKRRKTGLFQQNEEGEDGSKTHHNEKKLASMPDSTDEEDNPPVQKSQQPEVMLEYRRRKTGLFQQNNKEDEGNSSETTVSSVMNTTFECEPSVTGNLHGQLEEQKSEEDESEKVTAKPPVGGRRLRSSTSRRALKTIQDESIRSSDEFEKERPMRKSLSAGSLRRKTSGSNLKKSGGLKKKSSASDISVSDDSAKNHDSSQISVSYLDDGLRKKRRLYKFSDSFFGPPE